MNLVIQIKGVVSCVFVFPLHCGTLLPSATTYDLVIVTPFGSSSGSSSPLRSLYYSLSLLFKLYKFQISSPSFFVFFLFLQVIVISLLYRHWNTFYYSWQHFSFFIVSLCISVFLPLANFKLPFPFHIFCLLSVSLYSPSLSPLTNSSLRVFHKLQCS